MHRTNIALWFLNNLLLLVAVSAVLAATASADTDVSGLICSNTTWTSAGSPYIVTGNILVCEGTTLVIEPGVAVKFDSLNALQVDGTLIAKGTDGNRITFTSHQAVPAPGDWGYVLFSDLSTDATYDANGNYTGGSILEYCVIEYAGGANVSNNGAVRMDNAHPFINYCTVRNNTTGIMAWNLSNTLIIKNSLITDNTRRGIAASGGTVNISGNVISNNGGGIVLSLNTATVFNNEIVGNVPNFNFNDASGGGIYLDWNQYNTYTISKNIITENKACSGGGGIAIVTSWATIESNIISHNAVGPQTQNGGCASSGYGGGGISAYANSLTISHNVISDNTSAGDGGGIGTDGFVNSMVGNSIIRNSALNAAALSDVGGVLSWSPVSFSYNTITGNTSSGGTPNSAVYMKTGDNSPSLNYNNIFGDIASYELWDDSPQGSTNMDATNNWWGTANDSNIQAKIYDYFDDSSKARVIYIPYATSIRTDAPISPPTGLTATGGTNQITLNWSPNPEGGLAGYKVYWGTTSGFPYANVTDVGNTTSHVITSLAPGPYYVAVTSYDTTYAEGNDDPATIVNENQTNGNESWYASEKVAIVVPQPGSLQFSSATYNINESGSSVMITVSRTGGNDGNVGVSYATSDGSAKAGLDYTSTRGTLSWANGDTADKTLNVPILNYNVNEGDKTVILTLSNPTGGATLGSPSATVLTITPNVSVIYVSNANNSCSGHNPCWPNIQNGIGQASGPSIIEITQGPYDNENIVLDSNEEILLEGGWDTNFTSNSSCTTINGSITITNGTMIIENIILQ